jgi:hypothetical protein
MCQRPLCKSIHKLLHFGVHEVFCL